MYKGHLQYMYRGHVQYMYRGHVQYMYRGHVQYMYKGHLQYMYRGHVQYMYKGHLQYMYRGHVQPGRRERTCTRFRLVETTECVAVRIVTYRIFLPLALSVFMASSARFSLLILLL